MWGSDPYPGQIGRVTEPGPERRPRRGWRISRRGHDPYWGGFDWATRVKPVRVSWWRVRFMDPDERIEHANKVLDARWLKDR